MSETVAVALIVAVPPTLLAIAALVTALQTHKEVKLVVKATNSLVDRLVARAHEAGHALGVQDERARLRPHEPPAPQALDHP